MNLVQEAKCLGRLVGVDLADLGRASIPQGGLGDHVGSCGTPDTYDPELANSQDYDKLADDLGCDEAHARAVQKVHHSLLVKREEQYNVGWGSCVEGYDGYNSVPYHVDFDSFSYHWRRKVTQNEIRELTEGSPWWGWSFDDGMDLFYGKEVIEVCLLIGVEETYRLTGCAHEFDDDVSAPTGIHVLGRVIPGSTIGVGWFPNGRCSDHVEFHLDNSWNSSIHAKVGLTGHECGHCNGEEHQFSGQDRHKGVMSYRSKYPYEGYSTGKAPHTLPEDPSWRNLKRKYPNRPVPADRGPGGNPPTKENWKTIWSEDDLRLQRKVGSGGPGPIDPGSF